MNRTLIKYCIGVIVTCMLWAFVGIEHVVGDHELGSTWEPFVKHRPSLQMRFTNPAQRGLEQVTFETLSPAEQTAFIEFCGIRFGASDPEKCHAALAGRSI